MDLVTIVQSAFRITGITIVVGLFILFLLIEISFIVLLTSQFPAPQLIRFFSSCVRDVNTEQGRAALEERTEEHASGLGISVCASLTVFATRRNISEHDTWLGGLRATAKELAMLMSALLLLSSLALLCYKFWCRRSGGVGKDIMAELGHADENTTVAPNPPTMEPGDIYHENHESSSAGPGNSDNPNTTEIKEHLRRGKRVFIAKYSGAIS